MSGGDKGETSFLEKEKVAPGKDGLLPALPEVITAQLGAFSFLEHSFVSEEFSHLVRILERSARELSVLGREW